MPQKSRFFAIEKRSGVYRLQNLKNGKFYIGSSRNLYRRFYSHMQMLKDKRHDNLRIKIDCNLHGWESFVFGVVEYCDENIMKEREQYYYDLWSPSYNVWKNVYSANKRTYTYEQLAFFKSYKHGPKDLQKHSQSLKKAWKRRKEKYTPEELSKKMADARRGILHSEETKLKLSMQRKGKKKSEAWKEKLRARRIGTKLIDGKFVRCSNGI